MPRTAKSPKPKRTSRAGASPPQVVINRPRQAIGRQTGGKATVVKTGKVEGRSIGFSNDHRGNSLKLSQPRVRGKAAMVENRLVFGPVA